jgi:hypothetical protein
LYVNTLLLQIDFSIAFFDVHIVIMTQQVKPATISLTEYIKQWQDNYNEAIQKLPLFQPQVTALWSHTQQQAFALTFCHSRGHYYKFLWYLGSLAPSKEYRDVILQNYRDEFGQGISHEQLYWSFAKALGVDVQREILEEKHHFDFIRTFNQRHLNCVVVNDWDMIWGSFSAYEALDNIDYANLYQLVRSFGIDDRDPSMMFFKIHLHANHFETTTQLLENTWVRNEQAVREGFEFIAENQIELFTEMSSYLNDSKNFATSPTGD